MRSEATYGVSRIAHVLDSSRVRLCSLLRASNRGFVLPFDDKKKDVHVT